MVANAQWRILAATLGLCLCLPGAGLAQARNGEPRGRLLYAAYCDKCHTTEVHWRAKKAATDWDALVVEVRRWQKNSGLSWDENDVLEVSRYLNATSYHFPQAD